MIVDQYELKKIIGKGKNSEIYLTTMKESEDIYATKKYERTVVEGNE